MTYIKLALVAVGPVFASVILYSLNKRTALGRLGKWPKQIIYGLVFGVLAILGTEFGVPITGAVINARDAAPLCAGLIFGAPAGIIAGVIGAVERWFAVLWGAGATTRLACSLATIIAGLIGAALRKWMFDNKKPAWFYGFAIGLVMEVLHMLMIFFTNMNNVQMAFTFVNICSVPMILTNSFSVMFALLAVSLLGKEKLHLDKEHKKLSQSFSRWLFLVVLVAFLITSVLTYILQTSFSNRNSEALLRLNIADVKADIEDASNANLLRLTRGVAKDIDEAAAISDELLTKISGQPGNDFSEINVIDTSGVIAHSTNPVFIGFDMSSGEQAAEFLVLLNGTDELVQSYQPITKDGTYMKYAGVTLANGGFVQVGYNAERFRQDIDGQVTGATRNRHVGENGFIIIAGDNWNIVSDPNDNEGQNLDKTGIWIDLQTMPENARFECSVYGEACYCMYALTEGYYIIAVAPVSEVLFSRNLSVYLTIFMEILIFAALFAIVYFLIKKLVVTNIHKINHTLSEITGGNLNISVDVRTNEEFASLSDDINSTVVTLKGYIAEAAARIDKELEVAKLIQSGALPSVFPPYPDRTDFDIFATMDTAKEVGGDFYDFYLLDANRLAFLVADVSGKGITAAMFMMKAKTLIKSYADNHSDVAEILTMANEALCEGNDAEMFVTCWMGILNFCTNTITFANAGHNAPLLRRRNGTFDYFRSRPGFVLGGMEGIHYRCGELAFNPGDEIYLYTDGVTEATDAHNELYGDDRLHHILNTLGAVSADEICHTVKADVDRFVGEAPQFDDITMLHLKLTPKNRITLAPSAESMAEATAFVEETLVSADVPMRTIAKMNIAVDEIYSNIIRYSGAEKAAIECAVSEGRIVLVFTDNGRPYDPTEKPDPNTSLSAEERDVGGLGIFMVKKTMDSVTYEYRDGLNILTLTKRYD
ncbi:MAG: SpoIIE family protein phosphatase [Thermoclostridium sp.]|nr:SpoIIE family protein phosphatase [Thermoclostridium sp.]